MVKTVLGLQGSEPTDQDHKKTNFGRRAGTYIKLYDFLIPYFSETTSVILPNDIFIVGVDPVGDKGGEPFTVRRQKGDLMDDTRKRRIVSGTIPITTGTNQYNEGR
jgi:hypothetical protein